MPWFRGYKMLSGALIFALFLIWGLMPAYGDQLDQFKQQQKKIQQEMERQKQSLAQQERAKKTFLGQLDDLEEDMAEVQNNLSDLEEQLTQAQKRVEVSAGELKRTEADLDERTGVFQQRVREVYLNGQVSYLEVAFQATSVSDFLTRFDLLEKLVEQDMEMLTAIETKKKEVEEKKAELESQRNRIAEIKSATESQKVRLSRSQAEKERLIEEVDRDKAETEKALDEMEQLSAQIAVKIKKIQEERMRSSNNHFSGRFIWPTPGYTRITSPYGYRIHPILKQNRLHTGVDIGAPAGTEIHAADDGTVIYTGWLGAYGNVVVIDHGDGISTMYAHQSKILASENQEVKQGDVIGKVGSTGWSTGPHLHFEVRKNGDPVNPMSYFK